MKEKNELEQDLGKELYIDRQAQFENKIDETARNNGWSRRKARRAIESNSRKIYKKFKKIDKQNNPKINLPFPNSTEIFEEST